MSYIEYLDMARHGVSALATRITAPSTTPLLPWIPKWVKVIFLALILINGSSFPFAWHIRVWWHAIKAYSVANTRGPRELWGRRERAIAKVGGIKNGRSTVQRVALPDDCDYNMHLSNSCYAKNSDACRMKWALDYMVPCFALNIYMALGASHWQYFKEIPIGTKYSIETRTVGWGDKWMHIVTEFLIEPKKGKGKSENIAKRVEHKIEDMIKSPLLNLSVPASGTDTPVEGVSQTNGDANATGTANGNGNGNANQPSISEAVRRHVEKQARQPRADGKVVCCISVTEYCFKVGRITIPPRIALFLSRLSDKAEDRERATQLLLNPKKGHAWIRGGWRDEPDADSLGREIGLDDGSDAWIQLGNEAMDKVKEGLSTFDNH